MPLSWPIDGLRKNWGGGRYQERPRHRTMPHAIVFYNDCFNVNFQIADDAFVMELRDSVRIYEEAAKTK